MKISAIIHTFNEEENLPYALASLHSWVEEIVVIDMHSTDRTRDIAESFGAKVYLHKKLDFADPARQFALEKVSNSWVVVLDADEIIPKPLSERLEDIALTDKTDVVIIPRLNYLLGTKLIATGWGNYQDQQIRFFKKEAISFSEKIHSKPQINDNARILHLESVETLSIHHFNYFDLYHFLDKLNRYTTIEANQAILRGEKASFFKALWGAFREFGLRYFIKQGYRDSWRGFYLSIFMAFYRFAAVAKLDEKIHLNGLNVKDIYKKKAEKLIKEYDESS